MVVPVHNQGAGRPGPAAGEEEILEVVALTC